MAKSGKKIVKALRVGDSDAGRVVGNSLKNLREIAGFTQAQIARRLKVGQASISKMEHRGDVQISTLQKYVEALGAELRIDAAFPASPNIISQLGPAFETDVPDENQLVFPIFGDDLFRTQRDVVLSIRPKYSEKIIHGKKTIELRRRFPISAPRGTIAYIYSTSPVRAIVGRAQISGVTKLPLAEIWRKYSKLASVNKEEFDLYFDGLNEGFALKFSHARPFSRRLELPELRERFGFEPPQSFLYANPALRTALENEYSDVSH